MLENLVSQFKGRLLTTTIVSALSAMLSILILDALNSAVRETQLENVRELIPKFAVLICLLFLISFFSQLFLAKLGTSFVYQLRMKLLAKIMGLSYQRLESIGGHRILASITTDVTNIAQSLALLPVFVVNLATILFCLGYLALQDFELFGVLIFGLSIGVGGSIIIMRYGRSQFIQLREKEDHLFSLFKTLVDGSKELNINQNRRQFFYDKLAKPGIEDIRKTELSAKGYWVLSESLMRTVMFLVLGIVIYVSHVWHQVSPVTLTGFVLFTTYLIGPIAFVQATLQSLVRGKISLAKLKKLDLADKKIQVQLTQNDRAEDWGKLVFNAVGYSYLDSNSEVLIDQEFHFSIGPIDLTIEQGDCIFICGGNGSGKSTFAKVLVGLYQPQNGSVSFAGQEINYSNLQWYRNHFSTIFSDFHLFEHLLDSHGQLVDGPGVNSLIEKLKISDKVSVQNGKLSTTKLSQGQKKRVAMLASQVEDASIYLFDEWAADQDPEFRHYFYTELLPSLKENGKTIIAITHDERYFHLADKLIKFDAGQIIETNLPMSDQDKRVEA